MAEDNRGDTPLMRQARRAAARSKTWSQAKQDYAARVSANLSPEPAQHELGIDAVGVLDHRTTLEIAAMSIVSGVTLQVSVSDDITLIGRINDWLVQRNFGPLKELQDLYGGNKRPQILIVGGGYNYFPEDDFVWFVMRLPWRTPECVVLLVNPEEGPTKVYRASEYKSEA